MGQLWPIRKLCIFSSSKPWNHLVLAGAKVIPGEDTVHLWAFWHIWTWGRQACCPSQPGSSTLRATLKNTSGIIEGTPLTEQLLSKGFRYLKLGELQYSKGLAMHFPILGKYIEDFWAGPTISGLRHRFFILQFLFYYDIWKARSDKLATLPWWFIIQCVIRNIMAA